MKVPDPGTRSINIINEPLSRVTVYALNCTLVQYLLGEQDSLPSLLNTTEKTMKIYANKGIGQ